MTIHDIISPAWTAEEAMHVCDLLEALRDAIWRVHASAIYRHTDELELKAAEAEHRLDD